MVKKNYCIFILLTMDFNRTDDTIGYIPDDVYNIIWNFAFKPYKNILMDKVINQINDKIINTNKFYNKITKIYSFKSYEYLIWDEWCFKKKCTYIELYRNSFKI